MRVKDLELDRALGEFEREHPRGATSQEIVAFLRTQGIRFSEATLRKYVQLGLLPRSRRVGSKGKHQGSWGLYPPWTVRQAATVKDLLAAGRTIEEVAGGMLGVLVDCLGISGDLDDVESKLVRMQEGETADREGVRDLRGLVKDAARNMERAADIARKGRDMVEIAI
jgi:hypothetical protein